MRKIALAGAMAGAIAMSGLAGIGHNMPPVPVSQTVNDTRAILPRRVIQENRRNRKLKQKLRRGTKWGGKYHRDTRFMRKAMKKGAGYHPGKLFKGHRI